MTLKEKIEADLLQSMKNKEEVRTSTLRMLKAAIINALIDRKQLFDSDIVEIIAKQAKQRQESIVGFQKGNREDLAEKEKKELQILSAYLPNALSKEEIETEVAKALQETGAKTKAQMGQVMKMLMERLKGKADGKLINELVSQKLR